MLTFTYSKENDSIGIWYSRNCSLSELANDLVHFWTEYLKFCGSGTYGEANEYCPKSVHLPPNAKDPLEAKRPKSRIYSAKESLQIEKETLFHSCYFHSNVVFLQAGS